jgi:hypothetical protein
MNIGRPSQASFDKACASGEKATVTTVCGNSEACTAFSGKRNLSKRKYREETRQKLRDYVLLKLGAPVVKIELDEQGLDCAIDEAFDIYEDYAPREFFDYYVFNTTPGKSVYKMPDDVGIIRNVFYKEQGTFAFQASDLDGAIPIEYFYPGGAYASIQGGLIDPIQPIWGRMGEWVLYKQYEQMYSRTSSNIGGWEWVSDMGYIKLYPTPCRCSRVMVHYLQKCKDWKDANQALREGALAHAMIILGHIRSKYTQIPGIQGGVQNDGQYMKDKGWELKQKWEEQLITRYGDPLPITMD